MENNRIFHYKICSVKDKIVAKRVLQFLPLKYRQPIPNKSMCKYIFINISLKTFNHFISLRLISRS